MKIFNLISFISTLAAAIASNGETMVDVDGQVIVSWPLIEDFKMSSLEAKASRFRKWRYLCWTLEWLSKTSQLQKW